MRLLDLLFPPRCLACGELIRTDNGTPLCGICLAKWVQSRRITASEHRGVAVRRYTDITDPERAGSVIHAVGYVPGARDTVEYRLIMRLKTTYDRRAAEFAADELRSLALTAMPELAGIGGDPVVTWIPRRHEAVRRYGFDHMDRTAKLLAKKLGISSARLLVRRRDAMEQKQLGIRDRRENAHKTIIISPHAKIDGKTVLLIDDIVTTGASLEAGAKELLRAGASQVIAMTLAATVQKKKNPRIEESFVVTDA